MADPIEAVPIADKIEVKLPELALLLGRSEPTVRDFLKKHKRETVEFVRFTDGRSHYRICLPAFKEWYVNNYKRLSGGG